MNDWDKIERLIEDGNQIASIRDTRKRRRDWSSWKDECLKLTQDHPAIDKFHLGLQLTTLADDIDKLRAYVAEKLPGDDDVPEVIEPESDLADDSDDNSPYKIFISHKTERDGELAMQLRDKLTTLSRQQFEIFISEGIPGGTDWQNWVEESVRNCNMLLFLHTTEHDDNRWLLYEAGLYRGSRGADIHLVCLKNPNLENPPPQLARLQAYDADHNDIKQFMMDLLYRGKFTAGWQVNPDLRDRDENLFAESVQAIEQLFLKQQISVDYFRNRLNIGPIPVGDEPQPLEKVPVEANDVTRQLLDLSAGPLLWQDIYEQCSEKGAVWLDELARAIERIHGKRSFDQVLTPFDTAKGRSCYPVISRVERLQNIPTSLTVIFVERGPSEDQAGAASSAAQAPPKFKTIVDMLNMARRFRWNLLSPFISELDGFKSSEIDLDNLISRMWAELEQIEADAAMKGYTDPEHVASVFLPSYRPVIKEYFNDYGAARLELQAATDERNSERMLLALRSMLPLNKRFLLGGVSMYRDFLSEIDPVEITDEDVFGGQ